MKKFSYIIFFIAALFFVSCSKDASETSGNENGQGGSLARFVLVDNSLYVIDKSTLSTYDVSNNASPVLVNKQEVNFGIETLYPFGDYLLIGSTTGMYIYSIESNGVPSFVSSYEHFESCDPVVAQGDYAYVTLRSTRRCGAISSYDNRLEVINISNVESPFLENQISLDEPKGLAVDGNYLFVCTSNTGIAVFDVSVPYSPNPIDQIEGFEANDVIAVDNNRLVVVCADGLRQFDYSDINNIQEISFIDVQI